VIALFGVVGWKNSGKTTLVAKLVEEFARRGLRVAAIKHAHHGFDVDHEGRDSFRYREAGASTIIVSSSKRVAIMRELRDQPEPALAELVSHVEQADIILVEGFKREHHPKIEVRRRNAVTHTPLAPEDLSILAIASDHATDAGNLPVFDLDGVAEIAEFILDKAKTGGGLGGKVCLE
jgi:molybdopterin-guanine dinucleotide biosynthesis protein B